MFNKRFKLRPHSEFKSNLNKWYKNYSIFHKFFHKNKILFNDGLLVLVKDYFDNLNKMYNIIIGEIKSIEEMEDHYQGDLGNCYPDFSVEEDKIIDRLDKLKAEIDKKVGGDLKFKKIAEILVNEYKSLLE